MYQIMNNMLSVNAYYGFKKLLINEKLMAVFFTPNNNTYNFVPYHTCLEFYLFIYLL